MPTQMTRLASVQIANSLSDALDASVDAFDAMVDAYGMAVRNFNARENDVDPSCIAVGLQAQALGIKTLVQWLSAISTVVGNRYSDGAANVYQQIELRMERLGLVIPDIMTL